MQESRAFAPGLAEILGIEVSARESIDFDQMGPQFVWPTGDLSAPDSRLEQFRLPCGCLKERIPDIVLKKAFRSSSVLSNVIPDGSK